jgi:hypothetical protein
MQMMRPLRRRIMCGTAARVHRNVGRRFRRSTKSQSSTFISQILALRLPPTSFTRMSMRPKRSTHAAISRLAGASSVRSPATATAAPPAAVIAAVVLSSPAASRSPSATRAPSREQQRDLAAQTVGGSGDDGDSVTYSRHRASSCTLPGANHRTVSRRHSLPIATIVLYDDAVVAADERGVVLIEHELASPSVAAIHGLADDLLMSDGARAGQAGR